MHNIDMREENNKLRELRISKKLTQVEAAEMLGISRRTYQKYESAVSSDDRMLEYYIYRLNELTLVDEENGILEIEDIKDVAGEVLSRYPVDFCYLFGSYAKHKAGPTSDVDLLIDSKITGLDFFGLIEELRLNLHKKVDLLKIDQLDNNQALLKEILKDGIKIYG